jgi:hypothetical protein
MSNEKNEVNVSEVGVSEVGMNDTDEINSQMKEITDMLHTMKNGMPDYKEFTKLKDGTCVPVNNVVISLDKRLINDVFGITITSMPTPYDMELMWNKQIDLEEAIINGGTEEVIQDLGICYVVMGDVIMSLIKYAFDDSESEFAAVIAAFELARILGLENSSMLKSDDMTSEAFMNAINVSNARTLACMNKLGYKDSGEFMNAIV